jgi:tRNA A37 threonylcarbamoyladenosine dehydratase
LSVGNAAALTLALEGVGDWFRLADFDALSLSNLNRLRAGVHDIGVNKAILAARQIVEIDPYVHVAPFPAGISATDIDTFLAGLDLLIEECDDLHIKVAIRERARALRIPVIMDTSDRGLLDTSATARGRSSSSCVTSRASTSCCRWPTPPRANCGCAASCAPIAPSGAA